MIRAGYYLIASAITVLFFATACKKNNSPSTFDNHASFARIFDDFWNGMSRNYVYWNIDTTRWDAIFNKYKPVFDQLDVKNEYDVKKSVALFREMTHGLVDGHYYLNFSVPVLSDSFVYPAYDRKRTGSSFHNPYPYSSITINYLDAGYYEGYDSTTVSREEPLYALCGTIQQRCLYFYCNRFTLYRSYASSKSNTIKPLLQYFFSMLHNMPSDIQKVIIDLRGNRGGDISDLNFFTGQFIDKPFCIGYTRYKSNSNRLAYTPWLQAIVTPQTSARPKPGKIIVLADNFTASLAELITLAIHSLPNGTFIGERTWGATGPLTSNEIYNDGSFDVARFMHVQTASAQFKYLNDKMYEGIGIPPDVEVPFSFIMPGSGIDATLEKALNE
jgi:carboxyl-terminal processing protease